MNIHEYQAKAVLKEFGVPVPRGMLATNVEAALAACAELSGTTWVVKAQIHAGGRGKAGGVRVCRSPEDVAAAAKALLGSKLVTKQTGEAGKLVHKVYVEEGLDIAEEFYFSLLVDREAETVAFVVSPEGGMDIEAVASETPDKIGKFSFPPTVEICREMAAFLGLQDTMLLEFTALAERLYAAFQDRDASLIEINPLVRTTDKRLIVLDAKMAIDDNALDRQPQMAALRDTDEEDAREIEAAAFGLNYIALDGDIGCMVNGAGLAMATMDMIQMKGAKPANFLDVGGGVTVEAVCEAFKLLFSDTHVKAVLVNIFGGIVRCDIIANGLIEAIKTHPMRVPVVMRLVGTNEEEGRKIVKDAGLDVRWADNLDQAASVAAQAAG
ncbi:MAG: ADP-forming succinate--CoA ligase subunit beta [Mariprofundaceae bacterium]|nr:ADP-forming succinate--CoA ligase subunit beta [Mariprofundaceae bacterium]